MLPKIDFILPCYNAGENWQNQLLNFYGEANKFFVIHFILVNDGSTGNEIEKQIQFIQSKNISINLISYPTNMGKGYALRQGVEASKAEYIVYTDVDFPFTDQSLLDVMNELVKNQADVIAGFRNENYYENKMSWFRKMLSKSFRFFLKNILRIPVSDTQCGLKGFNKKGREIFLSTKTNRYLFDFEFIYKACRNKNIRIQPIQVQLKDNVVFRKMKLNILLREFLNLILILVSK